MELRDAFIGDRRPRTRTLLLAISLPLSASVAFLLEYDAVLGFALPYASLVIALYAGWKRAGILSGMGTVFLAVLWRFVFPPFVGYLRWSMDVRYTPPRTLGYKLYPRGERIEGLTRGPLYAFLSAVVLGGIAYAGGAVMRQLRRRYATAA